MFGYLIMKCYVFDDCHEEDGDNNLYGTVISTTDCAVTLEDIIFFSAGNKHSRLMMIHTL